MKKSDLLRLMRYTDSRGIERYHKELDGLRRLVENATFSDGEQALDVIAGQVEGVLLKKKARKR